MIIIFMFYVLGDVRTLLCLIENGTDVNSISNHGTTALHLTAARNQGKLMNVVCRNNVSLRRFPCIKSPQFTFHGGGGGLYF